MRKSFWIILTVALVAIGTPIAHADSFTDYTISFTQSSGSDPFPIGTIAFDTTTPSISATIQWEGFSFGFLDSDLTAGLHSLIPLACAGPNIAQKVLNLMDGCFGPMQWVANATSTGAAFVLSIPGPLIDRFLDEQVVGIDFGTTLANDAGTLSITPTTATPEPGTVGLMLTGIGFLLAMRKRIARPM
jgi:hypothetical protein